MTSESDRQELLQIARRAILAHVTGDRSFSIEALAGSLIARPGGAFVTLHCRNELRGCIGHIEADQPVARVVARCAVAACSSDPRFLPVTATELTDLAVELSLLGALEEISGPREIEIGRHGLVVEKGGRKGLLLPQVATEWGWNCEQFLAHTCHKAGLARDAWKHGARLWRFEAEVFGDQSA
jgi:AmmeMemoRadiSam system protein A